MWMDREPIFRCQVTNPVQGTMRTHTHTLIPMGTLGQFTMANPTTGMFLAGNQKTQSNPQGEHAQEIYGDIN